MFDYHFGYWTSCATKSRPPQLCSSGFFCRTAAVPQVPPKQSLIKCRLTSITSDEGLLRHIKTLLVFGMRNGPIAIPFCPSQTLGWWGWSQRFHVCIILLVLNAGNFREWSTIIMKNHPVPPFPSIPYQAPVSHEIGKITIATSRDFPLGFHRRCPRVRRHPLRSGRARVVLHVFHRCHLASSVQSSELHGGGFPSHGATQLDGIGQILSE